MIFPVIHTNGTSPDSLLSDTVRAAEAIQDAIRLMSAVAPNARDYYPISLSAFPEAVIEHHDRMLRLRSVHSELMEIAYSISLSQTRSEKCPTD